jgi:hypothetical protein
MVRLVYHLRKPEMVKSIGKLYRAMQNMEPRNNKRRPYKPKLSPARRSMEIYKLAEGYEAGQSLRQLAAKYCVDRKTIALQLRKVGVKLRLPGSNVHRGRLRRHASPSNGIRKEHLKGVLWCARLMITYSYAWSSSLRRACRSDLHVIILTERPSWCNDG